MGAGRDDYTKEFSRTHTEILYKLKSYMFNKFLHRS